MVLLTPPYLVLVDREGNIVYRHSGYTKGDERKSRKSIKNDIVNIMKNTIFIFILCAVLHSQTSMQLNVFSDYGKNDLDLQETYHENRIYIKMFHDEWEVGLGLAHFDKPRSYVFLPEKNIFKQNICSVFLKCYNS